MQQKEGTDKLARSVAEFYELHGAAFSATRHAPWGVMKLVKDAAKPGDVLVDFGAGNGRLGLEIPDNVRYVAVEPSSALRQAAEKILAHRKNMEIVEGGFGVGAYGRTPEAYDYAPVPVADSFADVVACLAVLHHIPTREARQTAVQELARILKPGGMLVLTVWNLRSLKSFSFKNWLAAWLRLPLVQGGGAGDVWVPWKAEGVDARRYIHAFTLNELKTLFNPKVWYVDRREAWGNNGPTGILDARNLVVVAKKR
jgi:tRNA (uracil-5-)-methyltransferase TRM9